MFSYVSSICMDVIINNRWYHFACFKLYVNVATLHGMVTCFFLPNVMFFIIYTASCGSRSLIFMDTYYSSKGIYHNLSMSPVDGHLGFLLLLL